MTTGGEGIVVIRPEGRLDENSHYPYLRQIKEAIWAGAKEVVVDLQDTTFIDTYGLSMLIKGYQQALKEIVEFRVIGVTHPAVKMVFDVTKLDRIFPVEYAD